MNLTITKVFPEGRKWGEKYPDACSVRVLFDNGDFGEYGTKVGAPFDKHKAALEALVGKPSEFGDLTTKEYQGINTHQFKSYPGKPESGGYGSGGAGRPFVPAYAQTKEGEEFVQERMDRRTALMQAVAMSDKGSMGALVTADQMYAWLRSTSNAKPAPADSTTVSQQGAAQQSSGAPDVWAGPGLCSGCNAPEGKRHAKSCTGPKPAYREPQDSEEDAWQEPL